MQQQHLVLQTSHSVVHAVSSILIHAIREGLCNALRPSGTFWSGPVVSASLVFLPNTIESHVLIHASTLRFVF